MNPHFIFNCLNSIKNLIQEEDRKNAIHYLTQFSKLIRNVLNNSENKQITLEEELDMCRLYLEMEKLRFQNGFNFEINIDPNADTDFVKVPPMVLQPFLENAIWHGLLHKDGERLLKLEISQNKDAIKCVIEDNGVGRKKAAAMKSKTATNHKSFGTRLTQDRLNINRKLFKTDFELNIIDMILNGEPAGTKVELSIQV